MLVLKNISVQITAGNCTAGAVTYNLRHEGSKYSGSSAKLCKQLFKDSPPTSDAGPEGLSALYRVAFSRRMAILFIWNNTYINATSDNLILLSKKHYGLKKTSSS